MFCDDLSYVIFEQTHISSESVSDRDKSVNVLGIQLLFIVDLIHQMLSNVIHVYPIDEVLIYLQKQNALVIQFIH